MRLSKFFITVSLPILLEYGVQGVSFDYADPNDFQPPFYLGEVENDMKKLCENLTDKVVAGEKGSEKSIKKMKKKKKMAINFPLLDIADDPTGRCPYGVTFKKDCNRCNCEPKTGETLCTVMGCGKQLCAHGTKYKIDCNTCICDERTGVTRCTRKICLEGIFSNCIHGTHFMKDCNRCRCSLKTGKTTCTLKKCPTNKNKLAGKCPRGEYYSPDNGCNTCHCNLLSGRSLCTLVGCFTIEADKKYIELKNKGEQVGKCPHGKRFSSKNDGCKNCRCNPNTGNTLCDKSRCIKKDEFKIVELSKEQLTKNKNSKLKIKDELAGKCPDGIHFAPNKDGCKTCYCDPKTGATSCNFKACLKGDEGKIVMPSITQLAKNKNLKLKIKEAAAGCSPPEVILIGSCRCDCRLPSVAVCKQSCFLDPVG